MKLKLIFYLILIIYLFKTTITISIHRRHHHHHPNTIQIYWNSTNELFSLSSSQSTAILYVHLGDKVDFICPKSMNPLYDPVEYNSLYIVSKDAYRQCYSSNYKPLIRCNRPFETQIYTMTISNFLPYPDAIEFHEQQEYYFISTSNGDIEGIDQKYDGLCRTKNMKLIMDVQKYYNHYSSIPSNETKNLTSRKQIAKRKSLVYTVSKYISSNSISSSKERRTFILLCIIFCLIKNLIA